MSIEQPPASGVPDGFPVMCQPDTFISGAEVFVQLAETAGRLFMGAPQFSVLAFLADGESFVTGNGLSAADVSAAVEASGLTTALPEQIALEAAAAQGQAEARLVRLATDNLQHLRTQCIMARTIELNSRQPDILLDDDVTNHTRAEEDMFFTSGSWAMQEEVIGFDDDGDDEVEVYTVSLTATRPDSGVYSTVSQLSVTKSDGQTGTCVALTRFDNRPVLISGDSGVGKTTPIFDNLCRRLPDSGVRLYMAVAAIYDDRYQDRRLDFYTLVNTLCGMYIDGSDLSLTTHECQILADEFLDSNAMAGQMDCQSEAPAMSYEDLVKFARKVTKVLRTFTAEASD